MTSIRPTKRVVLATLLLSCTLAAQGSDTADAALLIKLLELQSGHAVAEIGAGGGSLTIALARHVGASGRLYASELGEERIAALRRAVDGASLANVTVIEGLPSATNLPESCCDALFMRHVYHHFDDPAAMNASIFRALRPGGRLAIFDFAPPRDSEATNPANRDQDGSHGVRTETLTRELEAAGFEIVWSESGKGGPRDRDVRVAARKPSALLN